MCKSIDPKFDKVCEHPATDRICQFCKGTSGLSRNKEEIFLQLELDRLLGKEQTWLQKAKSFTTAFTQHAVGGFKNCSDEEYRLRINECENCEYFTQDKRCGLCSCYMEVKARWFESDCPYPSGSKWKKAREIKELEELHRWF